MAPGPFQRNFIYVPGGIVARDTKGGGSGPPAEGSEIDLKEVFPWQRFLLGRTWGVELLQEPMRTIRLRSLLDESYPVIYFESASDAPGQGRHIVYMFGKAKLKKT